MSLYVRKQLDIDWSSLALGLSSCATHDARFRLTRQIENRVSARGDVMVCLSVRTAFDLVLRSLDLPAGSEVLVSAVTIPHMVEIIERHGLVAVPVDVDMDRLAPKFEDARAKMTERTGAVLIAHLFGARVDLTPFAELADEHGVPLIEDAAQAWFGDVASTPADVTMYSFGTSKRSTSLGGALVRVDDGAFLGEMRLLESRYPVQKRSTFAGRVLKGAALKALSGPVTYDVFDRLCNGLGLDRSAIVDDASAGFPGTDLITAIRHRPCGALLTLLEARLEAEARTSLVERALTGQRFATLLRDVARPGRRTMSHTFWLFPILSRDPEGLIGLLQSVGYDATTGSSKLVAVGRPSEAPEAHAAMSRIVYLPVYPGMPWDALHRLASLTRRFESCTHGAAAPARPVGDVA